MTNQEFIETCIAAVLTVFSFYGTYILIMALAPLPR